MLIEFFADEFYLRYLGRLNDTLVRAHLTRAQLELRVMPNRPKDLTQALSGLGAEALNPYTGRPFQWDKDSNTLWVEMSSTPGDGLGETRHKVKVRVPPSRL